jgi:hypothetical protein
MGESSLPPGLEAVGFEQWLSRMGVPGDLVARFEAQGFDTIESVLEANLTETDLRELGLEQMRLRKRVHHAIARTHIMDRRKTRTPRLSPRRPAAEGEPDSPAELSLLEGGPPALGGEPKSPQSWRQNRELSTPRGVQVRVC